MPSDVEAFLGLAFAGWHAVVDALSAFTFFSAHGFVAIPAGFAANFLFSHSSGFQNRFNEDRNDNCYCSCNHNDLGHAFFKFVQTHEDFFDSRPQLCDLRQGVINHVLQPIVITHRCFGLRRATVPSTNSITELSLSLLTPINSEAAVKTIQNQGSCRKCIVISPAWVQGWAV